MWNLPSLLKNPNYFKATSALGDWMLHRDPEVACDTAAPGRDTQVRRYYRNASKAACLCQCYYCLHFFLFGVSSLCCMVIMPLGDCFCGDTSNGCDENTNTPIQEHPKSPQHFAFRTAPKSLFAWVGLLMWYLKSWGDWESTEQVCSLRRDAIQRNIDNF